ncbi:cell wall-binding repeat-containing protein [Leifsonia sp. F6_8S_P_1B]|uniref:Cell wall-binding repeat-containing protein n=1 Tax=Leifsonia williamsii TaxID=3035919 RepID=A0ABT8KCI8_9MICO|nr:cell wall-binding repeat-containing protein [Leifsonia williamsii]MDN4614892.1 cell wall-binding repeat-containing protein [Leifsonia williamsii]
MQVSIRRVIGAVTAAGAAAALVVAGVTPASATQDPGDGPQPSLEQMNTARDHTLGATLDRSDGVEALAGSSAPPPGVPGIDVSYWQGNVDWAKVAAGGKKFAYVKATEDIDTPNSLYNSQWSGARSAGLLTGAYHFATPNTSSGTAQASYFLSNGGSWTADGRTLPPMLDIEANPYKNGLNECWGMTPANLVRWVKDFTFTVENKIGRTPVIYTNTGWWSRCTSNNGDMANYPLTVANWTTAKTPGALPATWPGYTFWQYNDDDKGALVGDQQVFNGTLAQLRDFALNARVSGADRFGTSASLAAAFKPGGVVYVASGAAFPDALSAGPATKGAGPVLLIQPFAIPAPVATELRRLKPSKIVVLGGATSVNASTVNALKSYSGNVIRYSGPDRYDTSAAVAATFSAPQKDVYVASGLNFPDALSGAAVAAGRVPGPLLLTTPGGIPQRVANELARLKPATIHVIGGAASVSSQVEVQLKNYTASRTPASVKRVSGADRFDTSAAIAAPFPAGGTVYVANGLGFPDALSGAPVAGATDSPVLLVQATAIPESVKARLQQLKPKRIVILGGNASVSPSVAAQLQSYRVG